MSKAPFEKFIIMMLFFNKSYASIVEKLLTFGYDVSVDDVKSIHTDIFNAIPSSIKDTILSGKLLDPFNESHSEWLNHYNILEYYDYTIRGKRSPEDPPLYFKWCEDCLWVHSYKDVMTLVNIFIFNGEALDCISDIIMFKFRKKIGVEALTLYKLVFWNCDNITAKEAFKYCIPFRDNSLIIREVRSGVAEFEKPDMSNDSSNDGSDIPFTFHNNEYLKWKIGYRNIKIPDTKDFLDAVKNDSYFKYYESMNMTQSVEEEIEDESGSNDKFGAFDKNVVIKRKRNVEEQRVKLAKNWLDIYIRADRSMPIGGDSDVNEFFKRIQQVELKFENEEKIVNADSVPQLLEDVKGDM